MQRFVRSRLTGLVSLAALAALAACGTKDTTTVEPASTSPATITSVVVTPASATLTVGSTVALVATVTADSALPRTVTWTSGNTAVATVSATGVVTAVAPGSTAITAASTYLASATGGATITVTPAQTTTTTPAVVSIASVLQGPCSIPTCNLNLLVAQGLPVDLTNIQGQINVAVNYDPGTTTPKSIGLFLTPSGGTAQACGINNIGTAQSSLKPAAHAVSTVTFTCNTASFTVPTATLTLATQSSVTAWKNGQYTLSAVYTDANNVTATASATQLATLNNGDFMYAAFPATPTTATAPALASANDANGLTWHNGSVNTTVFPVLYTPGRQIVTATVSLVTAATPNGTGTAGHASLGGTTVACGGTLASEALTNPPSFPTPPAFASTGKAAGTNVVGLTADTVGISVTTIDNLGNVGPVANAGSGCGTNTPSFYITGGGVLPVNNFIRFDDVGPTPGAYVVTAGNASNPPVDGAVGGGVPFYYGASKTNVAGDTVIESVNNTQNVVAPTIAQLTAQPPGVWLSGLSYVFSQTAGGYVPSPVSNPAPTGGFTASKTLAPPLNLPTLLTNGDSNGVGKTTVTFAYAPAVAGSSPGNSTVYTPITTAAGGGIPATSAATAYWLEMIETDALGNSTTSQLSWGGCPTAGVGACSTGNSTFGIDNVPPTTTAVGPTNDEIDGVGVAISHNNLVVSATDPQNTNGTSGSGFTAAPVGYTIAGLQGSNGKANQCASGTTSNSGGCSSTTFSALNVAFGGTATSDGDWLLSYKTYDQAGNATATTTLAWYIDHTPPTLASPSDIALPSSIDSTFTFSETAFDSLYLAGGNLRLHYCLGASPCARFAGSAITLFYPGALSVAAGVPFSQKAVKTGVVSASITQWFRSMFLINNVNGANPATFSNTSAQALPDSLALRAVDAANNLSKEDAAGIPNGNDSFVSVANSVNPYILSPTANANITDFVLNGGFSAPFGGSGFPTVSLTGATAGVVTSTTITATVPVPTGVVASPFTQVCFYWQGNNGPIVAGGPTIDPNNAGGAGGINGMGPSEYALIGCQANPTTTVNGANVRQFAYTSASFTPNAKLLVAGSPAQLNIIAIGVNTTHDAIVTQPAQITIVP